jgi:hypothetical protein
MRARIARIGTQAVERPMLDAVGQARLHDGMVLPEVRWSGR